MMFGRGREVKRTLITNDKERNIFMVRLELQNVVLLVQLSTYGEYSEFSWHERFICKFLCGIASSGRESRERKSNRRNPYHKHTQRSGHAWLRKSLSMIADDVIFYLSLSSRRVHRLVSSLGSSQSFEVNEIQFGKKNFDQSFLIFCYLNFSFCSKKC